MELVSHKSTQSPSKMLCATADEVFILFCESRNVCFWCFYLQRLVSDVAASSLWDEMRAKWKVFVLPDQPAGTDLPKCRKKGRTLVCKVALPLLMRGSAPFTGCSMLERAF